MSSPARTGGTLIAAWAGGVTLDTPAPADIRYAFYTGLLRRRVLQTFIGEGGALTHAARTGYVRKGRPFDLPEWVHTRIALARMLPPWFTPAPRWVTHGGITPRKKHATYVPGVGINVGPAPHELYDLIIYVSTAELRELRWLLFQQADWRLRAHPARRLMTGCEFCMQNKPHALDFCLRVGSRD